MGLPSHNVAPPSCDMALWRTYQDVMWLYRVVDRSTVEIPDVDHVFLSLVIRGLTSQEGSGVDLDLGVGGFHCHNSLSFGTKSEFRV